MTDALKKGWVEFIDHILEQDSREKWFVTLSFPFDVVKPVANQRMKDWIKRLSQALKDSGKDGKIGYICITAQQQREVLHFHLIVIADGLDRVDKSRWEEKWEDLTAWKRPLSKKLNITYHDVPKLIRRRPVDGRIQEAIKMERVADLEIQSIPCLKFASGGTCKILPAFPTIAKYLCNRHNSRSEGSDIVLKGIPSSFPNGK